ncbi:MAG: hypothetical protein KDD94_02520 [Calditrichaeota bacterium]|nr:hypothetical protein [Calditrichota bacterium]
MQHINLSTKLLVTFLLVLYSCENELSHIERDTKTEPAHVIISTEISAQESSGDKTAGSDFDYIDDTYFYIGLRSNTFELGQNVFGSVDEIQFAFNHDKPRPEGTARIGYFDYGDVNLSGVPMEKGVYSDSLYSYDFLWYILTYDLTANSGNIQGLDPNEFLEFSNQSSPDMADNNAAIYLKPANVLNDRLKITNLPLTHSHSFNDDLLVQFNKDLPADYYMNFLVLYLKDGDIIAFGVTLISREVVSDTYLISSADLKEMKANSIAFMKDPIEGWGLPNIDEEDLIYYFKIGKQNVWETSTLTFQTKDNNNTAYDIPVGVSEYMRHQVKFID